MPGVQDDESTFISTSLPVGMCLRFIIEITLRHSLFEAWDCTSQYQRTPSVFLQRLLIFAIFYCI